jgi:hypothetical protein
MSARVWLATVQRRGHGSKEWQEEGLGLGKEQRQDMEREQIKGSLAGSIISSVTL